MWWILFWLYVVTSGAGAYFLALDGVYSSQSGIDLLSAIKALWIIPFGWILAPPILAVILLAMLLYWMERTAIPNLRGNK